MSILICPWFAGFLFVLDVSAQAVTSQALSRLQVKLLFQKTF